MKINRKVWRALARALSEGTHSAWARYDWYVEQNSRRFFGRIS
jgi:hypothetical protein